MSALTFSSYGQATPRLAEALFSIGAAVAEDRARAAARAVAEMAIEDEETIMMICMR